MDAINENVIACLTGCTSSPVRSRSRSPSFPAFIEKAPSPNPLPSTIRREDHNIVIRIITLLRTAENNGPILANQLEETVRPTGGWTEWIAEKIIASLEDVIEEGRDNLGPAMQRAYDAADEAAEAVFAFKRDHPVAFAGLLSILAVGVLIELAPVVVEVLGFAELGPLEGSFAAWWEGAYAGFIPKGSLFSYLQRLGMTWGRV